MGELEVRGPWVSSAYYDAPETADRFTDDGWFRTGDIVSMDDERLHHHSRSVEGRDQVGRRVDQLRGTGEHDHDASRACSRRR